VAERLLQALYESAQLVYVFVEIIGIRQLDDLQIGAI
jgi:hypothetical protein